MKLVCSVFRIWDKMRLCGIADHLTIIQCDNSFSEMVIPVVMSYDEYGFVSGCELGQQMHAVFRKSREQRQALALSLRPRRLPGSQY